MHQPRVGAGEESVLAVCRHGAPSPLLIGSAIPLGILMGPMMCGLYLSFFKTRRGEPIELGTLFKGFDYFGPSVVATLLHVIPIIAIIVPAYIVFYVGFILSMTVQGNEPNPGAMLGLLGMFTLFWIVMFFVIIFLSVGFAFVYPLLVDRKMAAMDAIKLSFKAAIANFWRLLLLMFAHRLVEHRRGDALLRRNVSGVSDHVRRARDGVRTGVWSEQPEATWLRMCRHRHRLFSFACRVRI